MLHITSRSNAFYKRLSKLARGKHVPDLLGDPSPYTTPSPGMARLVLLEGIHLCQEWLQHHGQPQYAVFQEQGLRDSAELQALFRAIDDDRLRLMDAHLLDALSSIAGAQGVLFVVRHAPPPLPQRITQTSLWLDRVQDPGNVGTMLRTAAAAGIRQACLSPGCAQAWSSRVLRSAQGAHFSMHIHEQVDLLDALGRTDIPLCASSLGEGARCVYDIVLPASCVWVFGNEGAGVMPELLDAATHRVFIPQDDAVESLNVAVAAGICLFEHRRQLRTTC